MKTTQTTETKGINLSKLPELEKLIEEAPSVVTAKSIQDLVDLAVGGPHSNNLDVAYLLPNGSIHKEVEVNRVKNGISANYTEVYMRRRDPNCMVIADDGPTDKTRFSDRFGYAFDQLREETFDWLKTQSLGLFYFHAGKPGKGFDAVAVIPVNAGFFGLGLALLQGILDPDNLPDDFEPQAVIYTAPPFRHSHFNGKQVVVHNRAEHKYEMFSYNLYPGPSAKKGVYGMLIGRGEKEGWVTAHCSSVKVITPYDNEVSIMHEGASGGGKSEMLQQPHRQPDGRLLLGENIVTGDKRYIELPRTCDLQPVTDDMALCHPSIQDQSGKLWLEDAEDAWFIRVDHITEYGTDLELEKLTAMCNEPLLFLNLDAVANSRALIWEHTMDTPEIPCPNPRVILPRHLVPGIVNDKVQIDIRSIGLRTPPCTAENPNYGIVGLFHVLPPALAWLWRLVAPRGYANPSIIQTSGISSEGVGSYWPFATGKKVNQANLLLKQIEETPEVQYILTPNQHIGAWRTSFMPQWLTRDYLARRGSAKFNRNQIIPARLSLLGYAIRSVRIEGLQIPEFFLQVEKQPEIGLEGYDQGARILTDFFHSTLEQFYQDDLTKLGKNIIQCCLDNGSIDDYNSFI